MTEKIIVGDQLTHPPLSDMIDQFAGMLKSLMSLPRYKGSAFVLQVYDKDTEETTLTGNVSKEGVIAMLNAGIEALEGGEVTEESTQ